MQINRSSAHRNSLNFAELRYTITQHPHYIYIPSFLGSPASLSLSIACRTASPGKLGSFEEELYHNTDMADVPVVMAVFLQYVEGARTVGVAYCDATGRKLGACQFTDDEHFCNLETVLVQLGAKECVLPKVGAVKWHGPWLFTFSKIDSKPVCVIGGIEYKHLTAALRLSISQITTFFMWDTSIACDCNTDPQQHVSSSEKQ